MIEAKRIIFKYEEKIVLKNISLEINEGDFVAIIGANGSGKTTLLKHFNSLLIPTAGTVAVDGINSKENETRIRKKVGMVFQNPEDQLVNSIVEEDVAFGLENIALPTEEIKKRVKETLQSLSISHLAKENVNNLSFGQKQLVALAGVLAMKPKYIVFDEPSAMLDPKNKANLDRITNKLNKNGTTVVLATNNLADVKKPVKRAIILKEGKVVFDNRREILNREILRKAGLYEK